MSIRLSPKEQGLEYRIVLKLDSKAFSLKIPDSETEPLLTSKKVDVWIECKETEITECKLT